MQRKRKDQGISAVVVVPRRLDSRNDRGKLLWYAHGSLIGYGVLKHWHYASWSKAWLGKLGTVEQRIVSGRSQRVCEEHPLNRICRELMSADLLVKSHAT